MKSRALAFLAPTLTLLLVATLPLWAKTVYPSRTSPLDRTPGLAVTFTHGIASGDVGISSAALWTRISQTGTITVQVSLDPSFASLAFTRAITPDASTDQTAKIQAQSLSPGQDYYYRWLAPGVTSRTGSFKTAPAPGTGADLRFAFSGDSDGTQVLGQPFYNHFEALDAARLEALDFFVYLGDMIYSDSSLRLSPASTLDEYRESWRVNRDIQALPDLLAATSTYAIWDDHEVRNDFAGQTVDPVLYANGRQAMLEYMPISDAGLPSDSSCAGDPLFRVFSWGDTADIFILDERSCRSDDALNACYLVPGVLPDPAPTLPSNLRLQFGLPSNPPPGCLDAINDPSRTFLGPVQKQLFKNALLTSTARYKIVVNEVPVQQLYLLPYDRWEGYAAERLEILNFLRDNAIEDVLFMTADIHANFINEVFVDFFNDPQPLAWEFVTGPIATTTLGDAILALLGQAGLNAAQDLFDTIGIVCRHLDAYSYGLVEVDASSDVVTVSLRDDTGTVLVDQIHQGTSCQVTLGGSNYTYLPAVLASP